MTMKKIIIGNWKMNPKNLVTAKKDFLDIKKNINEYKNTQVVLASPFVYLKELSKFSSSRLFLGGQNVSFESEGAYTGEVSASMLADCRVSYVIIGHSERRALGETNEQINKKIKLALKSKISPVVCVGESDREHGMWYLGVVKTQLEECLVGISKKLVEEIIIAYEPIWAISTTQNRRDATKEDCQEMRIYIKKILADMFGAKIADKIRIIYGGSVDEKNAKSFLVEGGADGLLPGRASLSVKKFTEIVKIANDCYQK